MRFLLILCLASTLSLVLTRSSSAQITVQITEPATDNSSVPVHSSGTTTLLMEVRAVVTEPASVASVVASVGAASVPLQTFGGGYYSGYLEVTGMVDGEKLLSVVATGTSGQTVTSTRPFVYDSAPSIAVTSPQPDNVIRHSVRVRATCSDNSAEGCTAMKLSTEDTWTTGNTLSRVIDLSGQSGTCPAIEVQARDTRGNVGVKWVTVCVESSAWLREVVVSDGTNALALDGTRMVFRGCNGASLLVRDAGGSTTVISQNPELMPVFAAENRVVLVGPSNTLWAWSGGSIASLPGPVSGVAGNGKWLGLQKTPAGSLAIYDLSTAVEVRSWQVMGEDASRTIVLGIASDGSLLYRWNDNAVSLMGVDGSGTTVSGHYYQHISYVTTDGTSLLAVSRDTRPSQPPNPWVTTLTGGGQTQTLSARSVPSNPLLHDGWVAHVTDSADGQFELKLRAPDGSETGLATSSTALLPVNLAAGGEVLFSNSASLLRVRPGVAPQAISTLSGKQFWYGRWYVALGQALYEVLDSPGEAPSGVFEACPPEVQPPLDAGVPDAGPAEAGADAATPDEAGSADAGAVDAGSEDADTLDAQLDDAAATTADGESELEDAGDDVEEPVDALDASTMNDAGRQLDAGVGVPRPRKPRDDCSLRPEGGSSYASTAFLLSLAGLLVARRRRVGGAQRVC